MLFHICCICFCCGLGLFGCVFLLLSLIHISLELGSHTFIDTFEDQLVGKNTGDEVEVNVDVYKRQEYIRRDMCRIFRD